MAQQAPLLDSATAAPTMGGTPFENIGIPQGAFGQGVGAAAQGLGEASEKAGFALQGLNNETTATNLSTKYMADLGTLKGQYYAKEGQAAVDAAPKYQQDVQALRDSYLSQAAGNPEVTQMLGRDVASQTGRALVELGVHVPQQMIKASLQASSARIDMASTNAITNRNDPTQIQNSAMIAASEVQKSGELTGEDPDTIRDKQMRAVGGVYRPTIEALLSEGKTTQAQDLFDKNRGNMDAESQVKIGEALAPKVLQNTVAGIVGPIMQGTGSQTLRVPPQYQSIVHQEAQAAGAKFGVVMPDNVLAATVQHESGWQPNAISSDGQGSIGLGQIEPSTAAQPGFGVDPIDPSKLTDPQANIRFAAQYLAARGKAAGVTDWSDPEQAKKGFAAYNSGSNAAQYAETSAALAFGTQPKPGSVVPTYQFPDRDDLLAKGNAAVDAKGGDELMRAHVEASINHQYDLLRTQTESQRTALAKTLGDTSAALLAGRTDVPIPESDIRAVYPKVQADAMVADLQEKQQIGATIKGVALAPAADLPAMRDKLAPGDDPNITDFALREKKTAAFDAAVKQRDTQIDSDAGLYALNVPSVKAAYDVAQANPDSPALAQAYVAETKAQQAKLGATPQQISALPNSVAQNLVSQIESVDPAKGNVTDQLNAMQKKYGSSWNDVLASMNKNGLRPEYATLASMNAPGQETAQTDAQRMLTYIATNKGGAKALEENAGTAAKDIDKALADNTNSPLAEFNNSTALQSQGVNLQNQTRGFVRNLAMYYVTTGQAQDGASALQKATDGVVNGHYNFVDSARVPKYIDGANGQPAALSPDAYSAAADSFKAGLGTGSIDMSKTLPRPFLASQDSDAMLLAARNGKFVTNADGSGVVLMGALKNGAYVPLRKPDGSFLGFNFKDVPGMAMSAPQKQAGGPDAMMAAGGAL